MGLDCVRTKQIGIRIALVAAFVLLSGCAHYYPLPEENQQWVYRTNDPVDGDAMRWAPVFVVYGHGEPYNRIGRPTIRKTDDGHELVSIDIDAPSIYYMQRHFSTAKATYTNQIYRVHFPKVPFSFGPFNLTAGKNVGVLVIVTLDAHQRPILVTSVGTCGCYKAFVPTQYLSVEALPQGWTGLRQAVYGEDLPGMLSFDGLKDARIVIHLRPQVHRVMDLEVLDAVQLTDKRFKSIPMQSYPMDMLNRLPVNGGVSSLYYQEGVLKGHVKGSIKPLESLFMSIVSLDFYVGMDKAYADPAITENRFYTSLKPWRRSDSNMWDFARFLSYWGWGL